LFAVRLYKPYFDKNHEVLYDETKIDAVPAVRIADNLPAPGHCAGNRRPGIGAAGDTGYSGDGITANGTMLVSGLESGATWEYSVNQGVNWITGTGSSFVLGQATYPAGYIRARQTNAGVTSDVTIYPTEIVVAGNQIFNGDFEQGNNGFDSNYDERELDIYGNLLEGDYAVVYSAREVHSLWVDQSDHTYFYNDTISGQYFVANASGDATDVVWRSTSPITVEAGTAYRFEAYLMSLIGDVIQDYPKVKFQLGDGTVWTDMGTSDVGWTAGEYGEWHLIYADGTFSKSGTYYIRLLNMQTENYNDLGMDDIYFGVRGAAPSAENPATNPTYPTQTFDTDNMLSLSLASDTGASATDTITNNGLVNVSGVASSPWQYSVNGGGWISGSGTSIMVGGDGTYSVIAHKSNDGGITWLDSTAPLVFTLDTVAPVFSTGTASGHTLSLTFSETLNGNTLPALSDFQVLLDGTATAVSSISVNGSGIILTVADDTDSASHISLSYSKTLEHAGISDIAGNENTNFTFNLYAVNYLANGATSGTAPAMQHKTPGVAITLAGNTGSLAKTGYTWNGWNTTAAGNGTDYAGGATYTIDSALTLYAKWNANTYTVSFDAQGGDVDPLSKSVVYQAQYGELPTPTWTGRTFTGWYTQSEGAGDHITSTSIVTAAGSHSLYADWSLDQYAITFNSNCDALVTPQTRYHGSAIGALPTPTRTGFTFDSWYYDSDLQNPVIATDTVTSNLLLYAGWTINSYTVSFDAQGGDVDPTSKLVVYQTEYGELPTPTWTGRTFIGWYTETEGAGDHITSTSILTTADSHSLYADWSLDQYAITFDPNSGSLVMPQTRYHGSAIGALPTPTRTGFTFDSWYYDSDLQSPVIATDTVTSSLLLYAGWTINSYTVSYDANADVDGTPPPDADYDYQSTVTVSDNTGKMRYAGFAFIGWNTEAEGTGIQYLAGDQFIMSDQPVTLYAVWEEVIVPQTGDSAQPTLWAVLAVLALAAGILLKRYGKGAFRTGR